MRLLGIDYGTKRVGLAVGDTGTNFAFPLTSIAGNTVDELTAAVLAIASGESTDEIVVGMPRRLSGDDQLGDTEKKVMAFVEALRSRGPIPVSTEDERMTTALVEKERRAAGIQAKDFDRDAAAAAAILETYMERKRNV